MTSSRAKKHTKIEKLDLFGTIIPWGPPALWFYANDYLSAAKALLSPIERFDPAPVFLLLRALELALKAFLSLKGCPLEKLAGGKFWLVGAGRGRWAFGLSTVAAGSARRDTARVDSGLKQPCFA